MACRPTPVEMNTWQTLPKPKSLPTEQNPTASDKWGQYRDVPRLHNRSVYPPSLKNRQEKTWNCVDLPQWFRIPGGLLAKPLLSLSAVDTKGYGRRVWGISEANRRAKVSIFGVRNHSVAGVFFLKNLRIRVWGSRLSYQILDDLAVNVREPAVDSVMADGQSSVVDSQ